MSTTEIIGYSQDGPMDQWGAKLQAARVREMSEPRAMKGVGSVATGSKSGNPTCDNEGIEPWIVNAARDLANDAMHIPTIARIIKRHVPTSNNQGDTRSGQSADNATSGE